MVENLIQANDCLLQIKIGDTYKDFLCGKSFTVTINTDEKEITTDGDGVYKSYDYKALSYTVNINGGMRIPDNINPTNFDFIDYQKSFEKPLFRIAWVDPNGAVRTFSGSGVIKTNNLVTSASQIGDATIDILGDGEYFIGDSLDQFINLTLIITGNNTVAAFFKFWLLDTAGNVVFMTDTLPQASGGNLGNPLNLTVLVKPGQYYFYYYVDTNSVGNQIDVNTPVAYSAFFNNGVTQHNTFPAGSSYDFTADRTVTVQLGVNNPPPTCVPPTLNSQNTPDGMEGIAYNGNVVINGLQPFTLSNVTKPSWMAIEIINGNNIHLYGSPTIGNNQVVSFDVTNSCGTYSFSTTINIVDNPNLTTIAINFTMPGSGPATSSALLIYWNGILLGSLNSTSNTTITGAAGDFIEVKIIGPIITVHKTLTAIQDPSTVIASDSTNGTASVSFTVLNASTTYTVSGTVTNN